jgi:hypothetical protein
MILSAVMALISIYWIGDVTIYSEDVADARVAAHVAVLENELPKGANDWNSIGANGLNARIATVWCAEIIHRTLALSHSKAYRIIDLASVFFSAMLLFAMLRRWFDFANAFLGVLLLALVLPLTMFLHAFQPWDKPSLVLWLGMTMAVLSRRTWLFGALYVLAIVNKSDSVLAVGLWPFLHLDSRPTRTVTIQTIAFAALGAITLATLIMMLPNGQEPRDLLEQLHKNISDLISWNIAYPPLLVYGSFSAFGMLAWKSGDNPQRRLWLFALALLIPHAVFTNFQEVRAQMGAVVSMIPFAVLGLSSLGTPVKARSSL